MGKRNMKAKLKEHESAVDDLFRVRLEIATRNTTPDYHQLEEVQNAMKELKLGKSVDPAGLIRKVLIRGGMMPNQLYYNYVQCI